MVADNERTKIPTLVIKFPKVYIYVGVGVAARQNVRAVRGLCFDRSIFYLNDRIPPIHVPRLGLDGTQRTDKVPIIISGFVLLYSYLV